MTIPPSAHRNSQGKGNSVRSEGMMITGTPQRRVSLPIRVLTVLLLTASILASSLPLYGVALAVALLLPQLPLKRSRLRSRPTLRQCLHPP